MRVPLFRLPVLTALLTLLLMLPALAQSNGGKSADPATATGGPTADTLRSEGAAAGSKPPASQDSLSRPKSRADTVLVVKHSFNHRQQIITGSVVMTCLAMMLVIMNNYNPR